MIRWFWRIYIPIALVFLVAFAGRPFGPAIEAWLSPVRIHNENLEATRYPDRVCWIWSSDKHRNASSENTDTFLDVLDDAGRVKNTFDPGLYRRDTGLPWQSGLSIAIGHVELPYCIDIPRTVKSADRIRVRFTPIFHGWHDLWDLRIATPDIVDPPVAPSP